MSEPLRAALRLVRSQLMESIGEDQRDVRVRVRRSVAIIDAALAVPAPTPEPAPRTVCKSCGARCDSEVCECAPDCFAPKPEEVVTPARPGQPAHEAADIIRDTGA